MSGDHEVRAYHLRRRRPSSGPDSVAIVAAVFIAVFVWGGTHFTANIAVPLWLWVVLCVALGIVVLILCRYLMVRLKREAQAIRAAEERAAKEHELLDRQLAELKSVTPLAVLLERNQQQINEYHRIATEQADQSFRSSQRAMWLGLLVVAGCFAGGVYLHSGDAKVFMGAIAAVGASLAAFLNRTYLHMYGQALAQLNRYFEQPVLNGYYLTAERLALDLGDNPESELRRTIVEHVLAASAHVSPSSDPGSRVHRSLPGPGDSHSSPDGNEPTS